MGLHKILIHYRRTFCLLGMITSLLTPAFCAAQNQPDFSAFSSNLQVINPAFSGKNGATQLVAHHRKVWSGMQYPIHSSLLGISAPVGGNWGLGIQLVNDNFQFFNNHSITANISYAIQLNQSHDLLFGMGITGEQFVPDFSGIRTHTPNDPEFINAQRTSRASLTIGISLRNSDYYLHAVGFNLSNLHRNTYRINAGGGLFTDLNDSVYLTNSFLLRMEPGTPMNADITSMVSYLSKYHFGFGYRWNSSVSINALIDANPWLQLGYSYGIPTNTLYTHTSGSHEFFMRFFLLQKRSSRFSWHPNCF
ncbi:conserved exported hypothetical protein [Tenacibaculum litopenaei]